MVEWKNDKPNKLMSDSATNEKSYNNWIDNSFQDFEKSGAYKDLPGKGKPLQPDSLKGDVFGRILKEANFKPQWLELQHEIRDAIKDLLSNRDRQLVINEELEITAINEKISKYNKSCPNSLFQKGLLSKENIEYQLEKWM